MAELNEEYVRKLEDVLELYERPYNQAEPVVCLDEKPVTLYIRMCDRPSRRRRASLRSATSSTSGAEPPMCSARFQYADVARLGNAR